MSPEIFPRYFREFLEEHFGHRLFLGNESLAQSHQIIRSLGRLLEQDKLVDAMEQVLEEGKRFDEELTKLAEEEVNPRMLGDEEEGEDNEGENNGGGRKRSSRSQKR